MMPLVLVSGSPPIRARKLKYYTDRNFLDRRLPAPKLAAGRYDRCPAARVRRLVGHARGTDARLDKAWSELVTRARPMTTRRAPARSPPRKGEDDAPRDLPLFAERDARSSAGGAEGPTLRR